MQGALVSSTMPGRFKSWLSLLCNLKWASFSPNKAFFSLQTLDGLLGTSRDNIGISSSRVPLKKADITSIWAYFQIVLDARRLEQLKNEPLNMTFHIAFTIYLAVPPALIQVLKRSICPLASLFIFKTKKVGNDWHLGCSSICQVLSIIIILSSDIVEFYCAQTVWYLYLFGNQCKACGEGIAKWFPVHNCSRFSRNIDNAIVIVSCLGIVCKCKSKRREVFLREVCSNGGSSAHNGLGDRANLIRRFHEPLFPCYSNAAALLRLCVILQLVSLFLSSHLHLELLLNRLGPAVAYITVPGAWEFHFLRFKGL